jgi:putative transposase
VLDQLNTHTSEALVRLLARLANLSTDLGVKGRSGMLKSMTTREAFLTPDDRLVVFHYTPRHASWMNQLEIWFAILAKEVVRHGNFAAAADLGKHLLDFVAYFNATLAKLFRWTYQGNVPAACNLQNFGAGVLGVLTDGKKRAAW